eukprot:Opistho-2@39959
MATLRNEASYSSYASFSPNSPALTSATVRSAHEEATVEGVMNRWRVRPIYDNYSATVAPSAPDTMSVFLSLRAELLKSTLATAGGADTADGGNDADISTAAATANDMQDMNGLDSDASLTNKDLLKKGSSSSAASHRKDDYTVRHLSHVLCVDT